MKREPSGPRLWALLWALALLGGCGFLTGEAAPAPGASMFIDVPLPSELEVNQKRSEVFESAQGRVGMMTASGRVKAEAVENYYREAMLQNGWTLDREFSIGETRLLVFGKSPRSAAVKVVPGWICTDLEINVSAKK
jgi:hypothetical protein